MTIRKAENKDTAKVLALLHQVLEVHADLRPDLFIERFVGEVPPRFVNETPWGLIRNAELLRMLEKRLEERDTWQGRLLECI